MKKVSMLQINNSFSGQNYLPYSAALLAGCFKENSEARDEYTFDQFIYKRSSPNNILNEVGVADVLGLSLYAWNVRLSLEVARRFKAENPNSLVFAGGPSAPDNADDFLRLNPFIDVVLHNEGEVAFSRLLEEEINGRRLERVPSASFIRDRYLIKTDMAERISDLEAIPSPFLSGVLDKIMAKNPDEKWIGLWETNRGCPFTCTYCDWGSATGSKKISRFSLRRLEEEIEWFAKKKIEFIFCCDANFGMFPRDTEIAQIVGKTKERLGYPHALSVQNTKNSTERSYATQKVLCDYGLNKGVTLSMQSMSGDVLKNIKRSNIRLDSYLELQSRFQKDGVPTYSDLILGLPGETFESFVEGLGNLIESGQHNRIQFNNLSILPNAEMAKSEYRSKFGLVTVETDIVNMHGSLETDEESILEKQELVIGSDSLSSDEWIKTRVVCWLIALLYFDKVAQIQLSLANGSLGVPMREIIKRLLEARRESHPCISHLVARLRDKAIGITKGENEYVHSSKWLDVYWPADEYMFIELTLSGRTRELGGEIKDLLFGAVMDFSPELSDFYGKKAIEEILENATELNCSLLSRPGNNEQVEIRTRWNIGEYYTARMACKFCDLREGTYIYRTKIGIPVYEEQDEWLTKVVWYGNKRGAYINQFDEFANV